MGFAQITSWQNFDDAIGAVRSIPGVFKDDEEMDQYCAALDDVIATEKDAEKKLKIGNDFANLVKSAAEGGLREALKTFPVIGSLLT